MTLRPGKDRCLCGSWPWRTPRTSFNLLSRFLHPTCGNKGSYPLGRPILFISMEACCSRRHSTGRWWTLQRVSEASGCQEMLPWWRLWGAPSRETDWYFIIAAWAITTLHHHSPNPSKGHQCRDRRQFCKSCHSRKDVSRRSVLMSELESWSESSIAASLSFQLATHCSSGLCVILWLTMQPNHPATWLLTNMTCLFSWVLGWMMQFSWLCKCNYHHFSSTLVHPKLKLR